jgi:hypothetical protein
VLKEVADSEASDWNNIQDIQTRAIKENEHIIYNQVQTCSQ